MAKTIEQSLTWEQLPAALAGEKVRVTLTSMGEVSGRLVRIEAAGLVLEKRTVPRADVRRIETTRRKAPKWSLIGAAIGVGAAMPLLVWAEALRRNEGGINSGKIVGATVGIAALAGVAGYFAGRAADVDRSVILVVTK